MINQYSGSFLYLLLFFFLLLIACSEESKNNIIEPEPIDISGTYEGIAYYSNTGYRYIGDDSAVCCNTVNDTFQERITLEALDLKERRYKITRSGISRTNFTPDYDFGTGKQYILDSNFVYVLDYRYENEWTIDFKFYPNSDSVVGSINEIGLFDPNLKQTYQVRAVK